MTIVENRYDMFDFKVEIFNEEYMKSKGTLAYRENIDTLGECLEMIQDFPMLYDSQLVEVKYCRRDTYLKLNESEKRFVEGMEELIESDIVKNFIIN
jgi:hypothetical protein